MRKIEGEYLKPRISPIPLLKWRKGRDSNPRNHHWFSGFQDRRIRPLCHPSGKTGRKTGSGQKGKAQSHPGFRLEGAEKRNRPKTSLQSKVANVEVSTPHFFFAALFASIRLRSSLLNSCALAICSGVMYLTIVSRLFDAPLKPLYAASLYHAYAAT